MSYLDLTELKYRIALTMAPSIGPITARKLIEKLGSARTVFEQQTEALQQIRGIGPFLSQALNAPGLLSKAEREVEFLERHQIVARYFEDPDYPGLLNQCQDAPVILYTRGDQGLNCRRNLSVVGTRRATAYGRDMCREIIRGLASVVEDLVIISGLAYGIDVIGHRAALEYGLPTVAVLGHGMDTIYPNAHRNMARKILEQGALVTDFHSKMGPERNNFLRRNRIIAGLSHATLVVESGRKGGALITAGMASSYNRDVLAVPGRVGDDRSVGCNELIKNHLAALVEAPEDITNLLNWEEHSPVKKESALTGLAPSREEHRILQLIREQPGIIPGMLSSTSGIPIHRVLALLVEMELKQWVSVEPGNRYYIGIRIT